MSKVSTFLTGAALGAGAVYFFDPDLGRRRRALVRDKLESLARTAQDEFEAATRDLSQRARGAVARLSSYLEHDGDVSDDLLVARVRSRLGRAVSHPRSIRVEAHEGNVVLGGPVLSVEESDLVSAVRRIPGVKDVDSRLDVHAEPGDVPGLQGTHYSGRSDFLGGYWPPAWQLLAAIAGTLLGATGWPSIIGRPASRLAGLVLLVRALLNAKFKHAGSSRQSSRAEPREMGSPSGT